ncbi:MAG: hypothetical protein LC800_07690 [Acidobacteria bacterium]|nr:hypothetical protein [Acidobacteriota bacterium]
MQAAEESDGRGLTSVLDKRARTPAQRKLDSQLLYAVKRNRGETRGLPTLPEELDLDAQKRVLVDISAAVSTPLVAAIKRLGGAVVLASPKYQSIRARVALEKLETLALRKDVRFIAPAARPMNNKGATTN